MVWCGVVWVHVQLCGGLTLTDKPAPAPAPGPTCWRTSAISSQILLNPQLLNFPPSLPPPPLANPNPSTLNPPISPLPPPTQHPPAALPPA